MRVLPLALSPRSSTECDLSEWSIETSKREQLVTVLAYLYLQQEQNAQRVIETLETRALSSTERDLPNAVEKLTALKPSDLELLQHGNEDEQKS
jgi:hypothetical protein